MKTWMKVLLGIIAVPLVVILLAVIWVKVSVAQHLDKTYEIKTEQLASEIKGDAKLGEHIVRVRNGCVDCHGVDLAGGKVMDNGAMGKVYGPNLTPASLKDWSDTQILRAIRHGVGKEGKALVIMPSQDYQYLHEQDLAHILAFLRSLPPVEKAKVPVQLGPIASVLLASGKAPLLPAEIIDHNKEIPPVVKEEVSIEFGQYLANTACIGCHRPSLKGGKIEVGPPDWPAASDITQAALGKWTEADFIKTMKSGVNPSGTQIRPPMPIHLISQYSDTELKSLWMYLQTVK